MSDARDIRLDVKGMTCQGCVNAVTRIVKRKDPAADVKVDLASGRIDARTTAPAEDLAAALTAGGYEARAA
ncbi:MAG TPA: heavy metal-associated domain-containing protein [Beijerinckiaceae bacterium]|jgi:copper chaperone